VDGEAKPQPLSSPFLERDKSVKVATAEATGATRHDDEHLNNGAACCSKRF